MNRGSLFLIILGGLLGLIGTMTLAQADPDFVDEYFSDDEVTYGFSELPSALDVIEIEERSAEDWDGTVEDAYRQRSMPDGMGCIEVLSQSEGLAALEIDFTIENSCDRPVACLWSGEDLYDYVVEVPVGRTEAHTFPNIVGFTFDREEYLISFEDCRIIPQSLDSPSSCIKYVMDTDYAEHIPAWHEEGKGMFRTYRWFGDAPMSLPSPSLMVNFAMGVDSGLWNSCDFDLTCRLETYNTVTGATWRDNAQDMPAGAFMVLMGLGPEQPLRYRKFECRSNH